MDEKDRKIAYVRHECQVLHIFGTPLAAAVILPWEVINIGVMYCGSGSMRSFSGISVGVISGKIPGYWPGAL